MSGTISTVVGAQHAAPCTQGQGMPCPYNDLRLTTDNTGRNRPLM